MVQVARAPSVLLGGIFGSRFGVLIATHSSYLVSGACLLMALRKEARQVFAEIWIANIDVRAIDSSR